MGLCSSTCLCGFGRLRVEKERAGFYSMPSVFPDVQLCSEGRMREIRSSRLLAMSQHSHVEAVSREVLKNKWFATVVKAKDETVFFTQYIST